MAEWTRRRLLRTATTWAAAWCLPRPGTSEDRRSPTFVESAENGRRFLVQLFDPTLGLLPEFRGASVFWLFHDNYLAAKVLARTDPGLARRIVQTMRSYGVKRSGKIEILFGEAKEPLPFRRPRSIELKRVGARVIKTEMAGADVLTDWKDYTDLLFFAALARMDQDRGRAVQYFEDALGAWDGRGFLDRVARKTGLYATFKLALALTAAAKLGRTPTMRAAIRERLLAMQNETGGWVTDYDAHGRRVGRANTETTSLAILALDLLR